jgi:small subunit ribosomal protein S2
MQKIELKDLMKAGIHFGHRSSAWCPKMEPFLFGTKSGVHIINLEKTKEQLEKTAAFVQSIVGSGGKILYVGTKPQAKGVIKSCAIQVGMPYVVERWLGGSLTNFKEIFGLVKKLQRLIKDSEQGDYEEKYTKKERLVFSQEIKKLEKDIGGISDMSKLPEAIFITSVRDEKTSVSESVKKEIPIIGVCDSNASPENINHIIPANDDAVKSIDYVVKYITNAIEEGKKEYAEMTKNKPEEIKKEEDKNIKK